MLNKIYRKGLWVLDSLVGRLHLFLERTHFIAALRFSFYKKIDNSIFVKHRYPSNVLEKDLPLFAHYTDYHTASEEVFALNDVNVSERGVVFSGFNNFKYAFPHIVFRATYGWRYLVGQYLTLKKNKLPGGKTYILIYDFWSAGNYYHWLIDTLPRLWIIRAELEQEGYALLLPENAPVFIKASLAYFEIKQVVPIRKTEFVSIANLLVSHYSAGSGHIHPQKIREIKEHFIQKINLPFSKKLIYVSRGRQKTRRVINEASVIQYLQPLGFEVIYFEDHNFEEQVSLAKNAQVIISSHGANLTNALFMQENTRVLELIREDSPNFCYWALCNVVNVKYYYQLCPVAKKDHLLVDLELFKLNLQKILYA